MYFLFGDIFYLWFWWIFLLIWDNILHTLDITPILSYKTFPSLLLFVSTFFFFNVFCHLNVIKNIYAEDLFIFAKSSIAFTEHNNYLNQWKNNLRSKTTTNLLCNFKGSTRPSSQNNRNTCLHKRLSTWRNQIDISIIELLNVVKIFNIIKQP